MHLFRPSKIKAAFLYTNPVEESAWNYWHEMGRLEVQEKLGGKVETVSLVTPSRTEAEEAIARLIKEKYSVIFATSPVMLNSCIEPSLKHPETKLLVSSQLAGYHHVRTYYLRFYEAKFLLGMAAGMLSSNGKIGYIADYPIYGSPSMINAFALGKAAAKGIDHGLDLGVAQDLVDGGLLHIQDLSPDGQNGLVHPVSGHFGAASGGISLDYKYLALRRVPALAVGKLSV